MRACFLTDGYLFAVTSHSERGKRAFPALFYKGANPIRESSALWPNCLPKAPLTNQLGGLDSKTWQFKVGTQTFRPQQDVYLPRGQVAHTHLPRACLPCRKSRVHLSEARWYQRELLSALSAGFGYEALLPCQGKLPCSFPWMPADNACLWDSSFLNCLCFFSIYLFLLTEYNGVDLVMASVIFFLVAHLWHMEVPRLGFKSEL